MVGLPHEHAARQLLTEAAHEFLTELSELPEKVFQPERGEGGKPPPPASAQQIAAEEAKAIFVARRKLRRCAACGEKVPKSAKSANPANTSLRMGERGLTV